MGLESGCTGSLDLLTAPLLNYLKYFQRLAASTLVPQSAWTRPDSIILSSRRGDPSCYDPVPRLEMEGRAG